MAVCTITSHCPEGLINNILARVVFLLPPPFLPPPPSYPIAIVKSALTLYIAVANI